MRHFSKNFLYFFALTLFLFSCGKDDGPEPKKEEVAQQPPKEDPKEEEEPKEETPSSEESNKIADYVIIKGSTKVEGAPPSPNGAITMDLSKAGTSAVIDEGFDIPLISDADVVGAYIQFKAIDGGVSESYYNVDIAANLEENEPSGKSGKGRWSSKEGKSMSLASMVTEEELDIDFGPEIAPGEFCYIICVYDATGNISDPQEVCVTVNAWGGNATLVGTWNGIKYEDEENGVVETDTIGEEFCGTNSCNTEEYFTLLINADGTYETANRYKNRDINGSYGSDFDESIARGKWSYPDGADSDLILVEYYYSETDQDGTEEETYLPGESQYISVYKPEEIVLTATELKVISYGADDDGDGNPDYSTTTFFEKQ